MLFLLWPLCDLCQRRSWVVWTLHDGNSALLRIRGNAASAPGRPHAPRQLATTVHLGIAKGAQGALKSMTEFNSNTSTFYHEEPVTPVTTKSTPTRPRHWPTPLAHALQSWESTTHHHHLPTVPGNRGTRPTMPPPSSLPRNAARRLLKELETWTNIESKDERGIERLGPLSDDELLVWEAVINGRDVGCGYDGTFPPPPPDTAMTDSWWGTQKAAGSSASPSPRRTRCTRPRFRSRRPWCMRMLRWRRGRFVWIC